MKKILLISSILASFLLMSSVFAYDYTRSCAKSGSCSCKTGWCSYEDSCVSSTCSYTCPSAKANSKLTGNNCIPETNNDCECMDIISRPMCGGSTCSCIISGTCKYTCNDGYEWDGNSCVQSSSNNPPESINSGTSTNTPGSSCRFYEKWYDLEGNLSHYIFSTNNTGAWVNDTATSFLAVNNSWSNVTKALNDNSQTTILWKVYANDTDNSWTVSSHSLITSESDTTKPLWKTQGQDNSTAEPEQEIKLYAQGYDNAGLDYAWLKTNETGDWEIYETTDMEDATTWKWSNFTWAGTGHGAVGWKIYYNDTSGNINATEIMTFNVINIAPDDPLLNSPLNGAIDQALNIKLNITVNDKNNELLNVTFFDVTGNETICFKQNQENGILICEWENLFGLTSYEWYVNVTDGEYTTKSYTWEFLTGGDEATTTTTTTTSPEVETTIRPTTTILATTTTKSDGKSKTPLIIGGVIAAIIGSVIAIIFFTSVSRPSL